MAVKLVEHKAARGDATRLALMKAAEWLFAEKGPSNVTIREIVEKAGQKRIRIAVSLQEYGRAD